MLTLLAETAQNTPRLPMEAWVALISIGGTLLGAIVTGTFGIIKDRQLQNQKFNEWSWNNVYELMGDIDFLHRKIANHQMPIDSPSATIMSTSKDSHQQYIDSVNQLRNKLSRFSILISNKKTLHLLKDFKAAFERSHGRGLTYLPFQNSHETTVPQFMAAVSSSKQARDRLVEHVQNDLLSAIK